MCSAAALPGGGGGDPDPGGFIAAIALPTALVVGGAIIVGMAVGVALTAADKDSGFRDWLANALAAMSEAVAAGIQRTGEVVVNPHTALKTTLSRMENDLNRGLNELERALIRRFYPRAYPYIYGRW